MNKDDLQKRLNSAEKKLEELEQLKAEIESLKVKLADVKEDEIPELPHFEVGQDFWFVDSELKLNRRISSLSRDIDDYNRFHSGKYAELFENKTREIAMLLHCKWYVDREYVPDWTDDIETKYIVVYSNAKEKYITGYWKECEYGNVYFSNREAAQKAADWMNQHFNKEGEVLV